MRQQQIRDVVLLLRIFEKYNEVIDAKSGELSDAPQAVLRRADDLSIDEFLECPAQRGAPCILKLVVENPCLSQGSIPCLGNYEAGDDCNGHWP